MKLASKFRLPRKAHEASEPFAIGDKQPLPAAMRRQLVKHLPSLAEADLDAYRFERRSSPFAEARWDIFVFDPEGRASIEGREFFGGPICFWTRQAAFAGRTEPESRMHLPPTRKLF